MRIAEFLDIAQALAPRELAMEWDNSGLQVGALDWETERALLCLDVDNIALEAALETGAGLIVAHHPLIFRALKQISDPLLLRLIQHKIAVVSLHTNLDTAPGGVNHALAARLGLKVLENLSDSTGEQWQRVSVSVPESHAERLRNALTDAGAGRIGMYSACTELWPVEGTFRAGEGTDPFTDGDVDATGLSHMRELKLECMCDRARLASVLAAARAAHPYETPAIYHFPVANANPAYGLGLVCAPEKPLTLATLAERVRHTLRCPDPRVWAAGMPEDKMLERIAICGGSGASMLRDAARKADVYVSGDLGYHALLESPIPVIDAGHFYTEYPALEALAANLEARGMPCTVLPMDKHSWPRNMR